MVEMVEAIEALYLLKVPEGGVPAGGVVSTILIMATVVLEFPQTSC